MEFRILSFSFSAQTHFLCDFFGEDSFFSKIIFFKPCLKKKNIFLLCNPGWLRTIQIHMPFLSNVLSARIEGICHHTRPLMYTLKYKFCLVHLQILVCLRAVEIAKQLSALTVHPKDMDSSPSPHMAAYNHL